MTFAFSRDGAIPGSSWLSKVNARTKIPANAVVFVAVVGALITLPALIEVDIDGAPIPVAFYAVVSVGGDRALPRVPDPDLPALADR